MSKKHWKIIVDILMLGTILILFQTGDKDIMLHMAFGILMTVLFIIHNILNLSWWMTIGKGRYNLRRLIMTILNCLLLLDMFTVIFSGIMFAGTLHRFSSLLFLLLLAGHLGMHCNLPIRRKKKAEGSVEAALRNRKEIFIWHGIKIKTSRHRKDNIHASD